MPFCKFSRKKEYLEATWVEVQRVDRFSYLSMLFTFLESLCCFLETLYGSLILAPSYYPVNMEQDGFTRTENFKYFKQFLDH